MLDRLFAPVRHHWPLAALGLAGAAVAAGVLILVLSGKREEPDRPQPPAPAPPLRPVVEVSAEYPAATAEEVERQVTIPLETALANMPGLKSAFSRSLFGLAHLDLEFDAGTDFDSARQEVVNRLQQVGALPPGVTPVIAPARRFTDELLRYTLRNPRNELGQHIYTLSDLRALQDFLLAREFQRLPGVMVVSAGGTVKRYEVHPDPERLKRYGITLAQLQTALANSYANVGGEYRKQGKDLVVERTKPLLGGGIDPIEKALALKSAPEAAAYLRAEETRRLRELRSIVITSINNVPVRVDDIVEGGPLVDKDAFSTRGVVVGHHTRLGQVSLDRALGPDGKNWESDEETVLGILLVRKDADRAKRAAEALARLEAINGAAGKLLPGVKLLPFPAPPRERIRIRGDFPVSASLDTVSEPIRTARTLLREFPEVGAVLSQIGRAEGASDPRPEHSVELLVALKSPEAWPAPAGQDRPRTLPQLLAEMRRELDRKLIGVSWSCSPDRGTRVGPFELVEGEHLVKIFGPDFQKLEELSEKVREKLRAMAGVEDVLVYRTMGQSNLQFGVDREKCRRWGIPVADVNNLIGLAVHGNAVAQMIQGEKAYDIVLRWAAKDRADPAAVLDIPVDGGGRAGAGGPRLRLRDLVSPVGEDGRPDPKGGFLRPGPTVIYREQGQRRIALKFRVRGRDAAAVLAEAQGATARLFQAPYRAEWVRP
jgi:Cu/Ag efflux pump CusA